MGSTCATRYGIMPFMPKKQTRSQRRANTALIILSALIIGSLLVSAIVSLVAPIDVPPTATAPIFVTVLPIEAPSLAPVLTPTATVSGPAPEGPAVAPTQ